MLNEIMFFENRTRGTGRTTRTANSLKEWAIANPDKTGIMVAHDAVFARQLKQQFFFDIKNINVIGIGQYQQLRGRQIDRLEVDHFAQARINADLLKRMTTAEKA